jgi:hypothetical protein
MFGQVETKLQRQASCHKVPQNLHVFIEILRNLSSCSIPFHSLSFPIESRLTAIRHGNQVTVSPCSRQWASCLVVWLLTWTIDDRSLLIAGRAEPPTMDPLCIGPIQWVHARSTHPFAMHPLPAGRYSCPARNISLSMRPCNPCSLPNFPCNQQTD